MIKSIRIRRLKFLHFPSGLAIQLTSFMGSGEVSRSSNIASVRFSPKP